jgi:hypothetical protein
VLSAAGLCKLTPETHFPRMLSMMALTSLIVCAEVWTRLALTDKVAR